MSTCVIDGCDRRHVARGLCSGHYSRERKRGNLAPLPQPTLEERFWPRVAKTETCWTWTGASHPLGYGQIRVGGVTQYTHRVAYELVVGPIPEGLSLDHLCRNPSCVNPEHLEPVTHRVNVLRGTSPMAEQARMTVCKKGLHPLTGPNAYVSNGKRRCRECHREYQRNHPRPSKRSAA